MSKDEQKVRVQAQLDSELVDEANDVMAQIGLTPTALITMTYQQLVNDNALPFKPTVNDESKNDVGMFAMSQFYNNKIEDFESVKTRLYHLGNKCLVNNSFINTAHLVETWSTKNFDDFALELWQQSYQKGEFITHILLNITEPRAVSDFNWAQSVMQVLTELRMNTYVLLDEGIEESPYSTSDNEVVHRVHLVLLDVIPWKRRQTNKLKRRLLGE